MEDFEHIGRIIGAVSKEAPADLPERVLFAVEKRRRRAAITKGIVFLAASALSVAALFFAWRFVDAEFYRTGTFELVSLIFSDFQTVVANWYYFLISVAESLPVAPLLYALSSTLAFFVLVSAAAVNFKQARRAARNHFLHYA